ncbi:MAG: hypothetical protein K0R18_320 [Bacillales bacterium]|jgi:hypothetical protein|nr:hypothetical protein [Bacillales bacterium]
MKGFTDQGKRVQEFLETFLVMQELTTDGKIDYSTSTDSRNRINETTIEMTKTDVGKLRIYMKEDSKEINSGIVTILFEKDYSTFVDLVEKSNLRIVGENHYNGIMITFFKSKDFKKILNMLKKFL